MKKTLKIITALILCISLLMIPMQVMAAPEEKTTKPLYISEVKVGMGETSEEAAKELLAEGFTILKEGSEYADLNEKAGTNSGMKKGPTDKIVYIGYKTTDNPKQAITDLAVMNMDGGYSVEDYEILMENHLEGEIKPFVDCFIAALNEYRANYKKPKNTLNHIKADYYRQMLNKLIDDDTGEPLGDLLLNETKYEMGDEAYSALSDKEKQKHADILTLLVQGNGRAVLLLETLVTKSTDSADDSWIDRMVKTDTEELKAKIKEENPSLSTDADIMAELDKEYHDTAKKIYEKWDEFYNIVEEHDDAMNELENTTEVEDVEEGLEKLMMLEGVVVVDYLESIEYQDGTLLEFFERDRSEFEGDNIRALYPMAASLSAGQIAGLDFLSIKDLFTMVMTTEEGYNKLDLEEYKPASFFQDVDREIYEPGGVALTNAALRAGAKKDDDSDFGLSELGILYWGVTGFSIVGAISTYGVERILFNIGLNNAIQDGYNSSGRLYIKVAQEFTNKSRMAHNFVVGFTFLAVLMAGYSIYSTIDEMLEYYKVTFTPIPKYIVDETDITQEVNGTKVVINNQTAYYKVVPCNRKEGKSDTEKENFKVLGTSNDLNGDVGKQWLALYSVKYQYGNPILADSLKAVKGTEKLPNGYETGIHRFGEKPAFNLTSKYYCYNDDVKGTYVYFKHDKDTVAAIVMGSEETTNEKTILDYHAGDNTTGSFFSAGSLALGAGVGLLLGGGIAVLILLPRLKRKKEQQIAD